MVLLLELLLELVLVLLLGDSAKGAQRWLDFGVMRFQPSELMKLAMPLAIAAYLHQRTLPPQIGSMLVSIVLIAVPTGLVMVQPDLGTSLLVVAAGGFALQHEQLRPQHMLPPDGHGQRRRRRRSRPGGGRRSQATSCCLPLPTGCTRSLGAGR